MTKYVLYSKDDLDGCQEESYPLFWSDSVKTWVDRHDPAMTFYTESEVGLIGNPYSPDGNCNAEFVPWELGDHIKRAIECARTHIEQDPSLAVYMVRDYRETEVLGLGDLAWLMGKEGDCSKNEAIWLLDTLEEAFND